MCGEVYFFRTACAVVPVSCCVGSPVCIKNVFMVELCYRFCSDNIAAYCTFICLFAFGRFCWLFCYCAVIGGVSFKIDLFIACRAFMPVSRCIGRIFLLKRMLMNFGCAYIKHNCTYERNFIIIIYIYNKNITVCTAVPCAVDIIISEICYIARI